MNKQNSLFFTFISRLLVFIFAAIGTWEVPKLNLGSYDVRPYQILTAVLGPLAILICFRQLKALLTTSLLVRVLFAFTVFLLLHSLIFSNGRLISTLYSCWFAMNLFLLLLASGESKLFETGVRINAWLNSGFIFLQMISTDFFFDMRLSPIGDFNRPFGFFGEPAYALYTFLVASYFSLKFKRWPEFFLFLTATLCTYARLSYLVLPVFLALIFFSFEFSFREKRKLILGGLCVVLFAILINPSFFGIKTTQTQDSPIAKPTAVQGSEGLRRDAMFFGFEKILPHWTPVGFGFFQYYPILEKYEIANRNDRSAWSTHNMYLQIFYELGIAGLLLLAALLFSLAREKKTLPFAIAVSIIFMTIDNPCMPGLFLVFIAALIETSKSTMPSKQVSE